MVVGLLLRSVRVFEQFSRLEAGSGKEALSRPTHQRVTQAVELSDSDRAYLGFSRGLIKIP
jgi:hypothetical protein